MKIILPNYGAYSVCEHTGKVRCASMIFVISDCPVIYIALPQDGLNFFTVANDASAYPTVASIRKAKYKQMEKPNCRGIARYDLVSIE